VAWGSQDFKFVNDTDYPIKVTMDMGGGALTCTIYGTKTDDKTVSLSATSSVSGDYRYATLYKTVTVNGESETYVENTSAYLLSEE
jgi:vancomycin resistance protein YoaR